MTDKVVRGVVQSVLTGGAHQRQTSADWLEWQLRSAPYCGSSDAASARSRSSPPTRCSQRWAAYLELGLLLRRPNMASHSKMYIGQVGRKWPATRRCIGQVGRKWPATRRYMAPASSATHSPKSKRCNTCEVSEETVGFDLSDHSSIRARRQSRCSTSSAIAKAMQRQREAKAAEGGRRQRSRTLTGVNCKSGRNVTSATRGQPSLTGVTVVLQCYKVTRKVEPG